ncbi:phosphate ABC transporter permease PstA [Sphingobium indicum]|uniref:Phosphate transport system permease protein PstA n=2 Tax=Sphingobium indicum TaxID=332055 RepID=A0A1L5BJP7_SPHIB|nr:phosphate ABC transporter permease PstA [Sphingobium indicum]EPR08869.1 phosphate ABC transporter permease [Sphingobium indicum IP26]KEY98634.1 phosphate ABC transporter permease [Sphingomonas sp. BHC-A]APL93119.1 phosphate ABC transporter permease [Sphingobium indicum B90A]NYI22254.1 phosphate transport system permease protein [Sphingobium indicum]RYM03026.1 phosphate ABC transporter permease PstA [Sphingobium indicum]
MTAERLPTDWKSDAMRRRIARRYAAERRFRAAGLFAVLLSAAFLAFLLFTMVGNGLRGFTGTEIAVKVDFPASPLLLDPNAITDQALANANLPMVTGEVVKKALGADAEQWVAPTAWTALRDAIKADPKILAQTVTIRLPAATAIDLAAKGDGSPEAEAAVARLDKAGLLTTGINWGFLTASDGTDPTQVGIWGAFKGSLLTMLVTLALSFPIGVATAVYLEEYARKNWMTDIIEVSINNLAAVPSIIFGLLGLSIFLNFLHLPRSAALVGGMTLALMTMPVIVIAGRNAIKSVPPSIRDAALGIGASPVQVVFHHVLPLALPGILTGTIIGMARALGETAPLLMIGMRAFIATPPGGITDPATVLPVQIFLWSDEVSKGFVEKTSAAIIVLLVFLLAMNGLAIYLRNKFERRW